RLSEALMLESGSASRSNTRVPARALAAARLIEVVVLPTPPFWLATRSLRTSGTPLRKGKGWRNQERDQRRGGTRGEAGDDATRVRYVPPLSDAVRTNVACERRACGKTIGGAEREMGSAMSGGKVPVNPFPARRPIFIRSSLAGSNDGFTPHFPGLN